MKMPHLVRILFVSGKNFQIKVKKFERLYNNHGNFYVLILLIYLFVEALAIINPSMEGFRLFKLLKFVTTSNIAFLSVDLRIINLHLAYYL